jgi:hypothetical protein
LFSLKVVNNDENYNDNRERIGSIGTYGAANGVLKVLGIFSLVFLLFHKSSCLRSET